VRDMMTGCEQKSKVPGGGQTPTSIWHILLVTPVVSLIPPAKSDPHLHPGTHHNPNPPNAAFACP
jgi:hypothetical protein